MKMKIKFLNVATILSLLVLNSCNYLDVVPENDIETIETIFEKREQAEDWMKTCHVILTAPVTSVVTNPAFTGADEVVAGEYMRNRFPAFQCFFIGDGLQMSQEPYGNVWKNTEYYAAIRYCNIFIENIGSVYNMQQDEKDIWTAEIKALKAHYYFELMRRYGPVVLVPENIDANANVTEMQLPRSPIDTCVNVIVRLLDEAIPVLPLFNQKEKSHSGYYCKEGAAALKAHTLLLAASPIFNGNKNYTNFVNKKGEKLFNAEYDPEKWKRAAEAAQEAIDIADKGGKRLIRGDYQKTTALLSTMADIEHSSLARNFEHDEALQMFEPQLSRTAAFWSLKTLPYFRSTDPDYSGSNQGCIAPSMKMVEFYYTVNGLPIESDKEWPYGMRYQMGKENVPAYRDVVPLNADVLNLHLRREPRFYAHIAADRCHWQMGPTATNLKLVTAYQGEKFGTQATMINNAMPQNLTGYWMKKGSYSDVLPTRYAVDGLNGSVVIMFRLAELYLMKAEAWNEYLTAPDYEHVYAPLNEVRLRAGIPDVESAWENYSNEPGKVKTKEGMREIIRREWNIEFAFEGRRFWNLRRWLTAEMELNEPLYGWNILGNTAESFYNHYKGPIPVWKKRAFVAPRDYLFPIRAEEVLKANCVQNPNW